MLLGAVQGLASGPPYLGVFMGRNKEGFTFRIIILAVWNWEPDVSAKVKTPQMDLNMERNLGLGTKSFSTAL